MAKYIIEIPDEHEFDWVNKSSRLGFELCFPINETATNKNYYIPTGLKLESYTEPDREAIEDEVWEFARRIICPSDCCEDSISAHTKEIFGKEGWEIRGIFNDLSYQEARAKYDAWLKQKEEVHVGDEVTSKFGDGVVIDIVADESVHVLGKDGHWNEYADGEYRKTGRHFDEVEKLLERMKAE